MMNNIFKLILGILIASFVVCTTRATQRPEIPSPITQSPETINKTNSNALITSIAAYIMTNTTQTTSITNVTTVLLGNILSMAQDYVKKFKVKLKRTIYNFGTGLSQKVANPYLLVKRLFFILIFGILTITIIKIMNPGATLSFIQDLPSAILTIVGLLVGENRGMFLTPTLPSIVTKEIGLNLLLKPLKIPTKLDCSSFSCFFMSFIPWLSADFTNWLCIKRPIKYLLNIKDGLNFYEQLSNHFFDKVADKVVPTKDTLN